MTRTLGQFIETSLGDRKRGEVARQLGIHRNTLGSWIAGTRSPCTAHLDALATLLGWSDVERGEALRLAGVQSAARAA